MLKVPSEKCTACGACYNICPANAIKMVRKQDGFLYPEITKKVCLQCGKCYQVCPIDNKRQKDALEHDSVVYAMQSQNLELRLRSTSGGIFSELADVVLQECGNVVGAAYKNDFSVEHQMIDNVDELEQIRRSKYQQSEIGFIYREMKRQLSNGKKVLFCGTPCQVAGLKSFLGKNQDNLYVLDFICRGVSSPRLFRKYIHYLQKQYESEVASVWMKNKRNGWHSLTTVVTFKNGQEYIKAGLTDPYAMLYLKYNIGIRESCYNCQFKNYASVADITLGDFWGLDHDMDDDKGTSVLICRTPKGKELVNKLLDKCKFQEKDIEDVIEGNPCLTLPIERLKYDSVRFYEILNQNGFEEAYNWVVKQADV